MLFEFPHPYVIEHLLRGMGNGVSMPSIDVFTLIMVKLDSCDCKNIALVSKQFKQVYNKFIAGSKYLSNVMMHCCSIGAATTYFDISAIAGDRWNPFKLTEKAFEYACAGGSLAIVKGIMSSDRFDLYERRVGLIYACARGHVHIVQLLLCEGINPGGF